MENCSEMQELISRLLDEDLSGGERSALMEHLEGCPTCRAMYEAFSALSDSLQSELEEPPESLHENVMAELRREQIRKRNRRPWRTVLSVAAVAALVLGIRFAVLDRDASDGLRAKAPMAASVQRQELRSAEDDGLMATQRLGEAAESAEEEAAPVEAPAAAAGGWNASAAVESAQYSQQAEKSMALFDAAADRGAGDTVELDLSEQMDLAALLERLGGEKIILTTEAGMPVYRLCASDGVLELFACSDGLCYLSPKDGTALRCALSPEEVLALTEN